MIKNKSFKGLTLLSRTGIELGLKRVAKNPLVTVIFTRKEIEGDCEWCYSLEKEIFELPEKESKLLKPEKKGLLTRTGKRIERVQKRILRKLSKELKIEMKAQHNCVLIIVKSANSTKRSSIGKSQAKNFFRFI